MTSAIIDMLAGLLADSAPPITARPKASCQKPWASPLSAVAPLQIARLVATTVLRKPRSAMRETGGPTMT